MQYGYFGDLAKEYVITHLDTPQSWSNYLGSTEYGAIITNNAGGACILAAMSVIWYKVWFDLWYNKLRTLLVILSIAVGVFAVGTTFGMTDQLLPSLDAAHQTSVPSHVTIFFFQPVDRETLIALNRVPGIEDIEPLNAVEMRWKLISFAVTPIMANALGQTIFESNLDYRYNFKAALAWLVVVVIISVLASIIPARNAAQINVWESLSYE